MDRRAFLNWFGMGWLASYLPVALVACSGKEAGNKATPTGSPRTDGFQVVGLVAALDQSGQILDEKFAAGPVLVVRNPADKSLVAVNPTCTHQGCIVNWKADEKKLVCPCHGSDFDLNGKVLEGPAKKPLPTYAAKVEGDKVLVKI